MNRSRAIQSHMNCYQNWMINTLIHWVFMLLEMDYSYSYRSDGGLLLNPYNTTGTLRNARTIGNYRSFDITFSCE